MSHWTPVLNFFCLTSLLKKSLTVPHLSLSALPLCIVSYQLVRKPGSHWCRCYGFILYLVRTKMSQIGKSWFEQSYVSPQSSSKYTPHNRAYWSGGLYAGSCSQPLDVKGIQWLCLLLFAWISKRLCLYVRLGSVAKFTVFKVWGRLVGWYCTVMFYREVPLSGMPSKTFCVLYRSRKFCSKQWI